MFIERKWGEMGIGLTICIWMKIGEIVNVNEYIRNFVKVFNVKILSLYENLL